MTRQLRCRRCQSFHVSRSRTRSSFERLLRDLFSVVPYRCRACWTRFFRRRRRETTTTAAHGASPGVTVFSSNS